MSTRIIEYNVKKWLNKEHRYSRSHDLPSFVKKENIQGNDNWPVMQWQIKGHLHRHTDYPSVVYYRGSRRWNKFGVIHRDKFPAVIYDDGSQHWYFRSQRHRDGRFASIRSSGEKEYWKNDFQQNGVCSIQ
jgi:hypothetical protein